MKLYLETSVPNALFTLDAPKERKMTEELFSEIQAGVHHAWISTLYLEEVRRTPSILLRYQLEGIVKVYEIKILEVVRACAELATTYVEAQAFTQKNYIDALHTAAAVIGGCEALVSWNFRHIVRAWTMKKVAEVNRGRGLEGIVICTPEEVIGGAGGPEAGS